MTGSLPRTERGARREEAGATARDRAVVASTSAAFLRARSAPAQADRSNAHASRWRAATSWNCSARGGRPSATPASKASSSTPARWAASRARDSARAASVSASRAASRPRACRVPRCAARAARSSANNINVSSGRASFMVVALGSTWRAGFIPDSSSGHEVRSHPSLQRVRSRRVRRPTFDRGRGVGLSPPSDVTKSTNARTRADRLRRLAKTAWMGMGCGRS